MVRHSSVQDGGWRRSLGWAGRWSLIARNLAVAAPLLVSGMPAVAQQCLSAGNGPACTNPAGMTVSGGAVGISDNQNAFNVTNAGTITGTSQGIFETNAAGMLAVTNSA